MFGIHILTNKEKESEIFKYTPSITYYLSTDPMWYKYPHLSPYAYYADNPVVLVDPDGMRIVCPIFTFGISEPIFLGSKPIVSSASRISRLGTEIGNKLSTGGRTINSRRINVGRQTETEQLNRLGPEKNTQEFTRIDPKTGKEGTTIPDAMSNDRTVEVKNLHKQSLTKQLRLQEKVSNENGQNTAENK